MELINGNWEQIENIYDLMDVLRDCGPDGPALANAARRVYARQGLKIDRLEHALGEQEDAARNLTRERDNLGYMCSGQREEIQELRKTVGELQMRIFELEDAHRDTADSEMEQG